MTDARRLLTDVFNSDRALRTARESFLAVGDRKAAHQVIADAVEQAFGSNDADEAGARLVRMAELLLELGDATATRTLLRVLAHPDPGVRLAAGEAIEELLYDRYAEVAREIEAEIERGGDATALAEVPFILAEVGEPGGVKIAIRLLRHEDANVVGASIEALAQMGDPAAVKPLEALRGDKRLVSMLDEDVEPNSSEVTVGELATEAIEHLRRARAE